MKNYLSSLIEKVIHFWCKMTPYRSHSDPLDVVGSKVRVEGATLTSTLRYIALPTHFLRQRFFHLRWKAGCWISNFRRRMLASSCQRFIRVFESWSNAKSWVEKIVTFCYNNCRFCTQNAYEIMSGCWSFFFFFFVEFFEATSSPSGGAKLKFWKGNLPRIL